MESIKVTPEELETKANAVDREADGYYTEYTGLFDDVQTFTQTDYTGDDADAFREAVNSFEPDFRKMKELMNEYAEVLRKAAQNYRDTQANATRAAQSLRR